MKKNIATYYSLLAVLLVSQIIATVFNLSKSIGYGQQIKHIESAQNELLSQQSQIERALANEIAIEKIDQNNLFFDINQLAVVETSDNSLALK